MWTGGGTLHDVEDVGLLVRPTSLVVGYVVIVVKVRNLTTCYLRVRIRIPIGPRTLGPIINPIIPNACHDGRRDDTSTHRKHEPLKEYCIK